MNMEYRTLGRTGLKVSALGIGTWQLAGPLDLDGRPDGFPDPGRNQVVGLIRSLGDLGLNLIDTAAIYGDGEGERRVGEAIRGQRDRWIVSTKFGLRKGPAGEKISDASPGIIRSSLEESLRRMGTDYVDLYLYHSRPDKHSIAAGKEILEELKREGKLRFYGISTNRAKTLEDMARNQAAEVVMFSQSLITQPDDTLGLVQKYELGGLIRGALEGGKLSGHYFNRAPDFPIDDFRKAGFDGEEARRYGVFEPLCPPGVSMSALAIRYVLDFDTTHSVILGGKTLEQYREVIAAVDLPPLDAGLREKLRETRQTLAPKRRKKGFLGQVGRWLGALQKG